MNLLSEKGRAWLRALAPGLLLVVTAVLVQQLLGSSWKYFEEKCPNTDVLSWDANLRLSLVLDQYQELVRGDVMPALASLLRAPTWPFLRSAMALIVFLLSDTGPNTILDVAIGFVFYALVFPSIWIVAFEFTRSGLQAAVIWFFASVSLLFTSEIPAYGVSAMLEGQGMFFMLWTLYFTFKLYEQQRLRQTMAEAGTLHDFPRRKRFAIGLLVFGQALFHTKYPYGLMLLIAYAVYELVRRPRRFIELLVLAREQRYHGWRGALVLLFAGIMIAFVLGSRLPALKAVLNTKSGKYLVYALAVVLFLDFNVYLYRFRFEFRRLFDTATRTIYVFYFLPALGWLFLDPDRVNSTLGTQLHAQDGARSFLARFVEGTFDVPEPVLACLAAGLLTCCVVALLSIRKRGIGQGLTDWLGRPATGVFGVILIQWVILELLTSNKQIRHIYHLLPALFVIGAVWCLALPQLFRRARYGRLETGMRFVALSMAFLLPLTVSVMPLRLLMGGQGPAGSGLDLNYAYTRSRPLCFTGTDRNAFEPVRWMARRVDPGHRYMLVNSFHYYEDPRIAQSAGRFLASDFDLLLRMRTLNSGALRNAPGDHGNPHDFDRLLALGPDCDIAGEYALAESDRPGYELRQVGSLRHEPEPYCMQEYAIEAATSP